MITIQDVANRTNLSTATVTRVVNRRADVGTGTAAMEEEVICCQPEGRRPSEFKKETEENETNGCATKKERKP
jgi:hypothetical protein